MGVNVVIVCINCCHAEAVIDGSQFFVVRKRPAGSHCRGFVPGRPAGVGG
jgi:hypothetical protein